MEQGPSGLNPELRTPPLPATHVRVGTGPRVLARNYTTDQGRPSYLRVHSLRATSCRNFWYLLVTVVPFLVVSWRMPNTYPNGGVRRGTATQVPRDPGQPPQTTLKRLLSRSASSGAMPAGIATGRMT